MNRFKKLLPAFISLALAVGMVTASELLGDKEIIFPEITAITIGALASPLFFWSYSGLLKNVIDRLWALAEYDRSELIGRGRGGALLVAAGGSHPEPLYEHFDYMMKRLSWKNHGKAALLHTDDMDMQGIPECEDAYMLGASIGKREEP